MANESIATVPVFGTRVSGCPYIARPSAYAVVRNDSGAIAVVRTPKGHYLPGGGMEHGESPEQTICRETREETGLILEPQSLLGNAIEIVYSAEEGACFEKRCSFVQAKVVGQVSLREADHELIWVTIDQAVRMLSHQSQCWAIRTFGSNCT